MPLTTTIWSRNASSGVRIGDNWKSASHRDRLPVVDALEVHRDAVGQVDEPEPAHRRGGRRAIADRAGTIASSSGSASVAPIPRRKVRRGSAIFVMNICMTLCIDYRTLPALRVSWRPHALWRQLRALVGSSPSASETARS